MERRAVIDVGTNSVKLLVADVDGETIAPVCEDSAQTRLGAGFYETHEIRPDAIRRTADAVKTFSDRAAALGAGPPRVIATSAARDARNTGDLINAVFDACGLLLNILSGDREAEWAFRGVTSDPRLAGRPALIVDVGGGSSEFIVGDGAAPRFRHSYKLGTVRLLEKIHPADPPGAAALEGCRKWLREFLAAEVAPMVEPALKESGRPALLIGTGGTATLMARIENKMPDYNREVIEGSPLLLTRMREHLAGQWEMTLAARQNIAGLPPNRADVILTGVAIFEAIMERFGFAELQVSTRGLRFWALLQQ